MKTKELLDLIQIRNQVVIYTNSLTLDKTSFKEMSNLLPKMDKKIISILTSDEFKNFINPQD